MPQHRTSRFILSLLAVAALALALGGCPSATGSTTNPITTTTKTPTLFAVAANGTIYTYNLSTSAASSGALLNVGQNDAKKIAFNGNVAYLAIPESATTPGVYYFDASEDSPAAARLSLTSTNGANDVFIGSDGTGYAAIGYKSGSSYYGGDKTFTVSSSGMSEFGSVVSPAYTSAVGADAAGSIYTAHDFASVAGSSSMPDTVYKFGTDSYFFQYARHPNAFAAGSYSGVAGIFVGCLGSDEADGTDDSIVFISSSEAKSSSETDYKDGTVAVDGTPCSKLAALDSTHLIAVGVGGVNLITINGSVASAAELKNAGGSSVSGTDVIIYEGTAYIAGSAGVIYTATSSSTALGSISLGTSSDIFNTVGETTVTKTTTTY